MSGTIDRIARCKWPKFEDEQSPELKRHWLYEAGMLNRALNDFLFRVAEDGIVGNDFEDGAIPESKFDADLQASVGLDDGAVTVRKLADGILAASTLGRTYMADLYITAAKIEAAAVTTAKVATAVGAYAVPVGAMLPFGGEALPSDDYLICAGQAVKIADYPALYAAIGTLWGTGATGEFRVPDMRGYFDRGWAHTTTNDPDKASRTNRTGQTVGDKVGSEQGDELASHTHTWPTTGTPAAITSGQWNYMPVFGAPRTLTTTANGTGQETRPMNKAAMWMIRAR
jgi:microcystin-dependent protein